MVSVTELSGKGIWVEALCVSSLVGGAAWI